MTGGVVQTEAVAGFIGIPPIGGTVGNRSREPPRHRNVAEVYRGRTLASTENIA
jgi:hypothetical protein